MPANKSLTPYGILNKCDASRCARLIGNPVLFGSGPAAVIGDETRTLPLLDAELLFKWSMYIGGFRAGLNQKGHRASSVGREGTGSRMIRKPEDLP